MKKLSRVLLLSMVLTLTLMLSIGMTVFANGDDPVEYDIWVGGTQINSDNASDVFTDGKVNYVADSNTLTLNGYSYSGEGYEKSAIYADGDLIIEVAGTNSLTSTEANGYGIHTGGSLTINGSGDSPALDVAANASTGYAVQVDGENASINDLTMTVSGVRGIVVNVDNVSDALSIDNCEISFAEGTKRAIQVYNGTGHGVVNILNGSNLNGAGEILVYGYGTSAGDALLTIDNSTVDITKNTENGRHGIELLSNYGDAVLTISNVSNVTVETSNASDAINVGSQHKSGDKGKAEVNISDSTLDVDGARCGITTFTWGTDNDLPCNVTIDNSTVTIVGGMYYGLYAYAYANGDTNIIITDSVVDVTAPYDAMYFSADDDYNANVGDITYTQTDSEVFVTSDYYGLEVSTVSSGGNNTAVNATATISGGGFYCNGMVLVESDDLENAELTFTGDAEVEIDSTCYPYYAIDTGKLNIDSGTFEITYQNGTGFVPDTTAGNITGGTYNFEPDDGLIAEGYITVDNEDGTYTVVPAVTPVAEVYEADGTTLSGKYATLADAIANVGDGGVIKITADVDNANCITVPSGKNFTVDFQDHTYTVNKPVAGSGGTETQAFQLQKDSTITFKNGTINITEDNLTAAVAPAKNIMRVIHNYANLTLDNMTIDARNQYGSYQGGKYGLSFNNGTSVIKDTTIITSGDDVVAFDVYLNNSHTATSVDVQGTSNITGSINVCATSAANGEKLSLTLSGGTLSGDIIMDSYAEEAAITKDNDFDQAAPEGYQWNDNGNGTSTLGPKEPDPTGVEDFVTHLYNVCLDRDPDDNGLSYWVNSLNSGKQTGTSAAYQFVFSDEFKNKNLCNEHYIKQLYRAFMDREYDTEGLNHWLGQMRNGMTREAVFNSFAQSNEFKGICADYGINVGNSIVLPQYGTLPTGPCSVCGEKDNVTQFVERMYTEVLGRNPDAAGLRDWTTRLRNHTATGRSVASSFIFSNEYIRKNTSDEAYVRMLYKTMMNRDADDGGLNDWLNRMRSGSSRQDVFNNFVSSNEFNKICNSYGITRG